MNNNNKYVKFCEENKLDKLWEVGRRLAFLSCSWDKKTDSELEDILSSEDESLLIKWGQPLSLNQSNKSNYDLLQTCGLFLFNKAALIASTSLHKCVEYIIEGCQLCFCSLDEGSTVAGWEQLAVRLSSFKSLLETIKASKTYQHIVMVLENFCRAQKVGSFEGIQSISKSISSVANTKTLLPSSSRQSIGIIEYDSFFITNFQMSCFKTETDLLIDKSPYSVRQTFSVRRSHVFNWAFDVCSRMDQSASG